jgi:hypothetical protein
MATTAAQFTWKKTRDGEWVVCGPAKELRQAAKTYTALPVTARSGAQKWVQIDRVGKTFGDGLAYGYLGDDAPATGGRSGRACITGGNCSSFGSGRSCGGHDCDGH